MGLTLNQTAALIRALSLNNVPTDLIFIDDIGRDAFFESNPERLYTGVTVVIDSGTSPVLQLYIGDIPYDNTKWQDISGVIKGEKGDKGDKGELSADNLLYVSASSQPPIALEYQNGTRTHPFSTIQRAIDNLAVDDVGVEVVDGSVYIEDITLTQDTRIFAPNASIQGNITIPDGSILDIYIQEIIGTIDKTKTVGFYRNAGVSTWATGTNDTEIITQFFEVASNAQIDEILYLGDRTVDTNWRIKVTDGLLQFQRLESSVWTTISELGASITVDRVILVDQSRIQFKNFAEQFRTLVKRSTDEEGVATGNHNGRNAQLSNGEFIHATLSSAYQIFNDTPGGETQDVSVFEKAFTTAIAASIRDARFFAVSPPPNVIGRYTYSDSNGIILEQSSGAFEFEYEGVGVNIVDGENIFPFQEDLSIAAGDNVQVKLEFREVFNVGGEITTAPIAIPLDGQTVGLEFIPKADAQLAFLQIDDITTEDNVVTQIEAKTDEERLSFFALKDREFSVDMDLFEYSSNTVLTDYSRRGIVMDTSLGDLELTLPPSGDAPRSNSTHRFLVVNFGSNNLKVQLSGAESFLQGIDFLNIKPNKAAEFSMVNNGSLSQWVIKSSETAGIQVSQGVVSGADSDIQTVTIDGNVDFNDHSEIFEVSPTYPTRITFGVEGRVEIKVMAKFTHTSNSNGSYYAELRLMKNGVEEAMSSQSQEKKIDRVVSPFIYEYLDVAVNDYIEIELEAQQADAGDWDDIRVLIDYDI